MKGKWTKGAFIAVMCMAVLCVGALAEDTTATVDTSAIQSAMTAGFSSAASSAIQFASLAIGPALIVFAAILGVRIGKRIFSSLTGR